jgi:hypothetical protein
MFKLWELDDSRPPMEDLLTLSYNEELLLRSQSNAKLNMTPTTNVTTTVGFGEGNHCVSRQNIAYIKKGDISKGKALFASVIPRRSNLMPVFFKFICVLPHFIEATKSCS